MSILDLWGAGVDAARAILKMLQQKLQQSQQNQSLKLGSPQLI
jgi:hypothetical protein